jgi:hypothetical protein
MPSPLIADRSERRFVCGDLVGWKIERDLRAAENRAARISARSLSLSLPRVSARFSQSVWRWPVSGRARRLCIEFELGRGEVGIHASTLGD